MALEKASSGTVTRHILSRTGDDTERVLAVTVVKLWRSFSSSIRFFLVVVEDSGRGSGVLYMGTGVLPITVGVVVSLAVVGLSLRGTGECADTEADVDEAGRGVSVGAPAASPAEAAFGAWVSRMLGCSKSHETPCLEQLPQRG